VYDGGLGGKDIRLRIANGGAGQSGLIGAWADAFIQYCHKKGIAPFKVRPYPLTVVSLRQVRNQVGWYLGDTTESLGFLAAGEVDIAVTYNDAAEKQACKTGSAVARLYGFRVGVVPMTYCHVAMTSVILGPLFPRRSDVRSCEAQRLWG